MWKGTEYQRDELVRLVARHLGISQISEAIRDRMKSVFNAAIRRRVLRAKGQIIWREE